MNWINLTLDGMVATNGNVTQASVARATLKSVRQQPPAYIATNPTNDSYVRSNAAETIKGNNVNCAVTSENSDIADPVSLAPEPPTEPPNVAPVGGLMLGPGTYTLNLAILTSLHQCRCPTTH